MRVIFMGSPKFAVPVLEALVEASHDVLAVYSRPDRPSGRGNKTKPTAVKQAAIKCELSVRQPASLNSKTEQDGISALNPELIVVAAYGLLLPRKVLETPDFSCLNIHPSLLPRFRGPSPVSTAIFEGVEMTGVTIMQIDSGVDTGPIVSQISTKIGAEETGGSLTDRLFRLGANLLIDVIPAWTEGCIQVTVQDESGATNTRLLARKDGLVDWTKSADQIAQQVRAFTPWPGSHTKWRGKNLKIIEAFPDDHDVDDWSEGMVIGIGEERGILVGTGKGVLRVTTLQLEGGSSIDGQDFIHGHNSIIGSVLGE